MMKLAWLLVLLPTALGRIVSRDSASSTCKHLEAIYPDLTFIPLSPGYIKANTDFYTSSAWLGPACVVTAKPNNEHADLFWALRGGGNSFALATDFELKTLRVPKVTVGMANYGFGVGEQFIRSVHDFATAGTKDPKPTLTPLTNTFRYRSMNQWSQELDGAVGLLKGSWQRFYVLNIHASRKETIATVHDTFVKVAKTSLPVGVVVAAMAFPQVAEQYIHASTVNGGDPQDLDPDGAPYIWVEESITALATVRDEDIDAFYTKVNGEIRQKLLADGVKLPEYIYLNDANPAQDSFGTFPPDNLARLRKIRARYDPDRVFTDLMPGGWKVS